MAKKSFKEINNPAMSFISTSPEELEDIYNDEYGSKSKNTQDAHDAQDVHEVSGYEVSKTQGRKGKKFPRINMAFDEKNHEYLQIISRIKGVSITKYVNDLISEDHKTKSDLLDQYKKFMEGVK